MAAGRKCCSKDKIKWIFRDEKVTLITMEGQFKVCGCFFILILAVAGVCASLWSIFHAFEFVREYDMI